MPDESFSARTMSDKNGKHYNTNRGVLIALNRWQPWADGEKVRKHLEDLKATGATWRSIGRASGLGEATIWAIATTSQLVKLRTGEMLLAVKPEDLIVDRVSSGGAKWRIRSLVAMGHSYSRQARFLGIDHEIIQQIASRGQQTVAIDLDVRIRELWLRLWDKRPAAFTAAQKTSVTKALKMAEKNNWPTGANLDEDKIYDPDYQPDAIWQYAPGIGIA